MATLLIGGSASYVGDAFVGGTLSSSTPRDDDPVAPRIPTARLSAIAAIAMVFGGATSDPEIVAPIRLEDDSAAVTVRLAEPPSIVYQSGGEEVAVTVAVGPLDEVVAQGTPPPQRLRVAPQFEDDEVVPVLEDDDAPPLPPFRGRLTRWEGASEDGLYIAPPTLGRDDDDGAPVLRLPPPRYVAPFSDPDVELGAPIRIEDDGAAVTVVLREPTLVLFGPGSDELPGTTPSFGLDDETVPDYVVVHGWSPTILVATGEEFQPIVEDDGGAPPLRTRSLRSTVGLWPDEELAVAAAPTGRDDDAPAVAIPARHGLRQPLLADFGDEIGTAWLADDAPLATTQCAARSFPHRVLQSFDASDEFCAVRSDAEGAAPVPLPVRYMAAHAVAVDPSDELPPPATPFGLDDETPASWLPALVGRFRRAFESPEDAPVSVLLYPIVGLTGPALIEPLTGPAVLEPLIGPAQRSPLFGSPT